MSISGFDNVGLTDPFNPEGDHIRVLNDRAFSSRDHDNDRFPGDNCAKCSGGWWQKVCSKILLNDVYNDSSTIQLNGENNTICGDENQATKL